MPLPETLPVVPFTRPVRGEVALPGSKSITNRALLLAALCDGPVTLTGALFSEDTRIMADALRRLGFEVAADEAKREIKVNGLGGKIPAREAALHVGLAGTAARFLTALCAAAPAGTFTLDGVPQMRKRPMKGLLDALASLGAGVRCLGEEGHLPAVVTAHGLPGGTVVVDASESSQMLSALLMVSPLAREKTAVGVPDGSRESFVGMTAALMRQFGAEVRKEDGRFEVSRGERTLTGSTWYKVWPGRYGRRAGTYPVEPDATAASYFLALPLAAGGSIAVRGLREPSLQGDLAFAAVLRRAGAYLAFKGEGLASAWEGGGPRRGVEQDFHEFSDTFLTLAAISPLLEGPTTITGIAHTRRQETDRVGNCAKELRKLGQEVEETDDSLTIHPRPLKSGQVIETYGDHRFAMSFAILGCHDLKGDGKPWLSIKDPACCAKTFPEFFGVLEGLRSASLAS